MPVGYPRDATRLSTLLRRIRRAVDCSQRELAELLGVSATAVAQAESGQRDLPATVLMRAAELAGFRLALLDATEHEISGMAPGAVRDRAGRRFPAHLDTRYGDEWWWHGSERYSRERPWYTFDRDRRQRDEFRARFGAPPDHQEPQPGDAPEARARARIQTAEAARRGRWQRQWLEHRRLGLTTGPVLTCSCPPACDDLLFAGETLPARQRAVPHVEECSCRCDIA